MRGLSSLCCFWNSATRVGPARDACVRPELETRAAAAGPESIKILSNLAILSSLMNLIIRIYLNLEVRLERIFGTNEYASFLRLSTTIGSTLARLLRGQNEGLSYIFHTLRIYLFLSEVGNIYVTAEEFRIQVTFGPILRWFICRWHNRLVITKERTCVSFW